MSGLTPVADPKVGLIFPVCDGDEKHFGRFYAELTRLNFPFVAHFDHCCSNTKFRFTGHPLCVGSSSDDDPKSYFDESFRQRALDVLVKLDRFTHMTHMDVDETLERDAPEKIMEVAQSGVDVGIFRCLDLWTVPSGKVSHRVDGVFAGSQREKVFKLLGNSLKYPHPSSHAPNVIPHGKTKADATVVKTGICILHWGIMDMEDARVHKERWDTIYTRKLGGNPFGSYEYYFDPKVEVKVAEVPEELL